MYILSVGSFIERLFRNIFFLIDEAIYNVIPRIYNLLMSIARTSPLSQSNILDMASRIYKLLAVFMVFKVTLSLIMYIVNPDDFSDKSKGVSKLITNIVISLATLVLTPYIFSYAYQFQKIILEDNSLAAVIFGDDASGSSIINSAGDQMAYLAISPFLTPNTNIFPGCTILTNDTDGKIMLNPDCFGFEDADQFNMDEKNCKVSSNTANVAETLCNESWKSSDKNDLTRVDLLTYAAGVQYENYNLLFRNSIVTARIYDLDAVSYGSSSEKFAFDYSFIISTVVGVIIVLFLITTCMDVGLRSIKLAFLQLIAPIPILSYVDPKSGKDGMFKKWYQMCLKTYLSLFLKLLALYFAIYIIGRVGKLVDIIDGSYITNGYVKIFIIIGALMFAKNFTKILESLGVKLDGGFQLNPFKKMENEALGMKKPAAFANKISKGILTSPFSAAGLGAKKLIGGIDAMKNGKNFRDGSSRIRGKLYNGFYKKLDEWAPDSAESRKNERAGRASLNKKNDLHNKGEKLYETYKDNISDAFKHKEYTNSYNNLNKQKSNMYSWEQEVGKAQAELSAAQNSGDKFKISAAEKRYETAMKQFGKAKGQFELTKSKHEDIKKVYSDDAQLEDAHDFYMKNEGLSAVGYDKKDSSTVQGQQSSNILLNNQQARNQHANNNSINSQHINKKYNEQTSSNNTVNNSDIDANSSFDDLSSAIDNNTNFMNFISEDLKEKLKLEYEQLVAEIKTIDPNSSSEAQKRYDEIKTRLEEIEKML